MEAEAGQDHPDGVLYPIGALARLAEVSTRTIRYYEEIGLLAATRRMSGGRRVYDSDTLERMRFIGRLKTLGFSLEEIGHLNEVFEVHRSTEDMLAELDRKLGGHLSTLEERMRQLTALREQLSGYREHIRRRRANLAEVPPAAPPSAATLSGGAPAGAGSPLWFEKE